MLGGDWNAKFSQYFSFRIYHCPNYCNCFGVKWFKLREDKDSKKFKQNKKRTIITLVILIVCLFGSGMAQNTADEQEAEAQKQVQYAKDKKNYKDDKDDFIHQYKYIAAATEQLSNQEGKEWEEAIDNSDEDFDVDATIDNIEEKHSDDIDSLDTIIGNMHDADQKIQKNTAAPKGEKEKIHSAYLSLKHFTNHATDISGSYNDFTDEHNEMDQEVADKAEELQDL